MSILQPTSLIFITSKNRISGTPWDFNINFNNELIKAPKGHYIQLSVEQVSINRSWYSIQEGYNTFDFVNNIGGFMRVTLPPGYYNAADLRAQLQSQIGHIFTITYDKKVNKFTFTAYNFSGGVTWWKFGFTIESVAQMFGFNLTDSPMMTVASPTVVSSKPIKVNEDANILIRTNLPRQRFSGIDNLKPTFIESDILCSIPILSAPFDNVVFSRNSITNFTYNILAPTIHGVRIYVTNEDDVFLKMPYDWTMTWSIKYLPYNTDDTKPILENIRDMMRLFMLQTLPEDDNNDDTNQIISQ